MARKSEKTFTELGYSHLDTAEIVVRLNRLLSDYSVYQQKVRAFMWNATGIDFFDLHSHFKKMYHRSVKHTDAIAERIRLYGQSPVGTLAGYLELANIKENTQVASHFEMAKIILNDIKILLDDMERIVFAALEINDDGTEFLMKSFIYKIERDHWMLTSWVES